MTLNDRLQQFLAQQGVGYDTLPHQEVFTAQEVAAASHVPGRQLAKVVLVREEGKGRDTSWWCSPPRAVSTSPPSREKS